MYLCPRQIWYAPSCAGRIYFNEADEGNIVTVNYTPVTGGPQTTLTYTVAWEDEQSVAGQPSASGIALYDETTPESAMPIDVAVNEGEIAAFVDPFPNSMMNALNQGQNAILNVGSKLWVFWSSTRANEPDLYYEALSPNLYPTTTAAH